MPDVLKSEASTDPVIQFSVTKEKLAEAVNHVMKAVSSRTTIPILTGIKISASHDGLTLTGSDSDISIKTFIPAEEDDKENVTIEKTGSIVLQARVFAEMVKKMPDNHVDIVVDKKMSAKIISGSAEFDLNGLDPEEYPQLPTIEENNTIHIRTDLLKNIIRQTVFSVSTSETRPVLTGVNWNIKDGKLDGVATDSHRLASKSVAIESEADANFQNVVIPGKGLNELTKILDDGSGEWVTMVITDNQVLFKAKNIEFFTRLLDGNYPDTSRLIPSESKTEIIIKTKKLLQAIDRASLLAKGEHNNVVKLQTLSDNQVEIMSRSAELGRVMESVDAESIEGEELKISFSAKYMMDALSRMDTEDVRVSFTGAMRPFLIRPVEDDGILMLILPVRTN